MNNSTKQSLFLERKGFRQRRWRDVARMLPVLAGILWTIPLMWQGGADGVGNGTALLYIFGIWVMVIVLTGIVSRLIEPGADPIERDGG